MSGPPREALELLGRRLCGPAGSALAGALLEGRPAAAALKELGADPAAIRAVEIANPPDPVSFLEGMAGDLTRFHARRGQLLASASYAAVVAAAAAVAAAIVFFGAVPALALVRGAEAGAPEAGAMGAAGAAAFAFALAGLGYLGYALWTREPLFPAAEAKRSLLRALVLGTAARLSRQVPLPAALRAGAAAGGSRRLSEDAEAVALALEEGREDAAGRRLFGPLGAALFGGAARSGGGPATLVAMASLQEASAERLLPGALRRAEAIALALGGLALFWAAATFFLAYARSALPLE